MNNEPVAWIIKHEGDYGFGNVSCSKQELQDEIDECSKNVPHWNHGTVIPLYTHPVKELTDEEILNEWLLTNYNPKTYVWANDTDDDLVLQFAKAILRKAQEK